MKIAVFGGSGFLGSHVADILSSSGHEVIIFDLLKSKFLKKNQKFIQGNILNFDDIKKSMPGVECVFNFIAISNLNKSITDPIPTINVNLLGCVNLLTVCKDFKVKKYVHASTIYVGGDYGGFYKCSKHAAEEYIKEFYKIFGLKFCILRYGTLYGSRSNADNGVYLMIKDIIKKKKIIYNGNEESQREYINVVDAAKASIKALEKLFENKTVIITGRETTKVTDLLNIIKETLKIKSKIIFKKKDFLKNNTHYTRTPYNIQSDEYIMKYNSNFNIDLGQGIKKLILEIKSQKNE